MGSTSRRFFLLSGSALCGVIAHSYARQSHAQFTLDITNAPDLPNLVGSISDQVDYNIQEPLSLPDRRWDAVLHYAGTNTALLAPKVQEHQPADPPMPHFKPRSFLEEEGHVYRVDRERSNETGFFEVEGKPDGFLRNATETPDGFIIDIPPGKYKLEDASLKVIKNKGYNEGPRFIFRGEISEDGSHPEITFTKGTIAVSEARNVDVLATFASLEVENLELSATVFGPTGGPGTFLRYYRYDNVLFREGYRHAQFPVQWPTVGIYNNCVFVRAGSPGGGSTHSVYAGYTQAFIARNCLFASARGESHPLKTYSAQIDIRGCTIANWWHPEDMEDGFYSDQAPLDIGAWTQSVITNCHIIRRGNPIRTRNNPFIDIRNRLFEKGSNRFQISDFGTNGAEVDYRSVDNEVGTANETEPTSNLLYRHVIVNNKFFNGILPDNSIDPEIDRRGGYLIRNNGTIFNWAGGDGALPRNDPSKNVTPSDYGRSNERSVVYVSGNERIGAQVIEEYPGPYPHESDPAPVVTVPATFPDWVQQRISNGSGDLKWWTEAWPSQVEYHPAPVDG